MVGILPSGTSLYLIHFFYLNVVVWTRKVYLKFIFFPEFSATQTSARIPRICFFPPYTHLSALALSNSFATFILTEPLPATASPYSAVIGWTEQLPVWVLTEYWRPVVKSWMMLTEEEDEEQEAGWSGRQRVRSHAGGRTSWSPACASGHSGAQSWTLHTSQISRLAQKTGLVILERFWENWVMLEDKYSRGRLQGSRKKVQVEKGSS